MRALEESGCPRVLAGLLASRGLNDPDEARRFLKAGSQLLHDPLEMAGLQEAAALLNNAVETGVKLCVYGDYDVDGVTATALLTLYLKGRGADVFPYIPSREAEGYGLNVGALTEIARQGAGLVVTVDTGVSAVEEAKCAKELGLTLVITDHHRPRDVLPEADAVVDPMLPGCGYPFKGLAGVGVALKLACAMESCPTADMLARFGDLVCLGTVADVVPLTDENRALVKYGIRLMEKHPRPGIRALLEASGVSGRSVTASLLAFTLAPRINACGRMGSARQALELLCTGSPVKAAALAQKLCENNCLRQETESDILDEALARIEEDPEIAEAPIIVVSGENWHNGVIGIVAARVAERFGKPAVLISMEGDEGRGSCRSIPGFDIFRALHACEDLLVRYGGHAQAAGFTIAAENLDEFSGALFDYAFSQPEPPVATLELDYALRPDEVTLATVRDVALLEPFGCDNPTPLFLLQGATVAAVRPVSNGKHLRLSLQAQGRRIDAMLFNAQKFEEPPAAGDMVDCAINLERGYYNGAESLSVFIRALRSPQPLETTAMHEAAAAPEQAGIDGGTNSTLSVQPNAQSAPAQPDAGDSLPLSAQPDVRDAPAQPVEREDFAAVYRYLKTACPGAFTEEELLRHIGPPALTPGRLRVVLEVFEEGGLITRSADDDGRMQITLQSHVKLDLGRSRVLQKLHSTQERLS